MARSTIKTLYAILGSGVALAFVGHGILALKGNETFVELVIGNYDKLLGGSMSTDAATSIVNTIGVVDVTLAVAFLALVAVALRANEIAYSPLAIGLFAWAMAWGLATALARFTAVMNGAEIWDVIERGPNFMLPAAVVYVIYKVREEHTATERGTRAERPPAETRVGPATLAR